MSRIGRAFASFFQILLGREPGAPSLPAASSSPAARAASLATSTSTATAASAAAAANAATAAETTSVLRSSERQAAHADGGLALLAILQREGRFVDFIADSLEGASDADVAAAAREVHRGCKRAVAGLLALEPIVPSTEGDRVTIPAGFNASEVRIAGKVQGAVGVQGVLRHAGWKAARVQWPSLAEHIDRNVLHPAEVDAS